MPLLREYRITATTSGAYCIAVSFSVNGVVCSPSNRKEGEVWIPKKCTVGGVGALNVFDRILAEKERELATKGNFEVVEIWTVNNQ